MNESRVAITELQQRWPAAFPVHMGSVRPLCLSINPVIAAELGWSVQYCRGVLHVWKLRKAYCHAVMTYDLRRGLDGQPNGALVGEEARRMASANLAAIAAKQKKPARQDTAPAAAAPAAPPAAAAAPPAAPVMAVPVVPAPQAPPPRKRPILTLGSMRTRTNAPQDSNSPTA